MDDSIIFAEHRKISQLGCGCQFHKVDLHVHSPEIIRLAREASRRGGEQAALFESGTR